MIPRLGGVEVRGAADLGDDPLLSRFCRQIGDNDQGHGEDAVDEGDGDQAAHECLQGLSFIAVPSRSFGFSLRPWFVR